MSTEKELELAKSIYVSTLKTMKFTLDLEEYGYKEFGRNDPKYKYFKKMLMQETYDNLRNLFKQLADLGILELTDYEEDLKNGWNDSVSGGSGYLNSKLFNDLLKKLNK